MTPSIEKKLQAIEARYNQIQQQLSVAQIIADQPKFQALAKEFSEGFDWIKLLFLFN